MHEFNMRKSINVLTIFAFFLLTSCDFTVQKDKKSKVEFSDRRSPLSEQTGSLEFISPGAFSTFQNNLLIVGKCFPESVIQIHRLPDLLQTIDCEESSTFNTLINIEGPDGEVEIRLSQISSLNNNPITATRTFIKSNSASSDNYFQKAMIVMQNRCLHCHGSNGPAHLVFDYVKEEDFVNNGWIIPGDEHASKITNRTKFHNGVTNAPPNAENMPMGGSYNSFRLEEYEDLRNWVVNTEVQANLVNIFSPVQSASVVSNVLISGSCQENIDVVLFQDEVQIATTNCDGNFSRLIPISGADGEKVLIARQYDTQNEIIGTDSVTIIKDTGNTVNVQIQQPSPLTRTRKDILVEGVCSVGLDLKFTIQSSSINPSIEACNAQGTFSKLIELQGADGEKTIIIDQQDQLQTVLSSDSRIFIKDTTPPALTFIAPEEGEKAVTGLVLNGECEESLPITVSGNGITNPATINCEQGAWQYTVLFTQGLGIKNVTLRSTDQASNTSFVSRNFERVDTTETPILSIASPVNNFHTQTEVILTGICTPNIDLNISGDVQSETIPCTENGQFERVKSLIGLDGIKQIIVSQSVNGNTLSDQVSVFKDNTSPNLEVTSPENGTETFGLINVQGNCESGISNVIISSSAITNTLSIPCNGNFSANIDLSGEPGSKTIQFSQQDLAMNSTQVQLTLELTPPDPAQQRFQAARQVMASSCFHCHNSGNTKMDFLTEEEFELAGLVVPGNINNSKITSRTKWHNGSTDPNSLQNMPEDNYNSFPQASYETLKIWIENMQSSALSSGNSRFQIPRIASRKYVKSVLIDVFGPSIDQELNRTILSQSPSFSGPCDRYETTRTKAPGYLNSDPVVEEHDCFVGKEDINLSMNGSTNVLRAGWTIQACEVATDNINALDYAKNKIFNGGSVVNPSNTSLDNAYQLFYPGKTLPTDISDALMQVSNLEQDTNLKWKNVLLTICMSSEWQAP